ncbi:MAG TPA: hypothetical protein P5067_08320 [Candidatus Marinimicrobia bacterium]|nr:hypothetical protein [Candidatus Neomarinimicrobiota bacterium]HRS52417.1 hypothetical protein [Candidatus Neomarinimicrobiota bacterium]
MTKSFMIIVVNLRKKEAVNVQKILTEWGCLIKTRLGLHEGVLDQCSETGSIILELVGERDKHIELARKLNLLAGVKAQYIEIPIEM